MPISHLVTASARVQIGTRTGTPSPVHLPELP